MQGGPSSAIFVDLSKDFLKDSKICFSSIPPIYASCSLMSRIERKYCLISTSCLAEPVVSTTLARIMYQSNRSFNIPLGQPPGHLNFRKTFVQIPFSPGRKVVQMPLPPGKLPDYCFNFSVAVRVNKVY